MSNIYPKFDKFFRRSMQDKVVAENFFQQHLPKELLKRIDLKTLKLDRRSFIDKAMKDYLVPGRKAAKAYE